MTPARTRRTVAVIIGVWVLGLIVVLGLWQRVDAACSEGVVANDPMTDCAPVSGIEPAR